MEFCSVDPCDRAHRCCGCFHRGRGSRAFDAARAFRRLDRYPGPPFTMEHWSIELEKESFKFSAAHFLIFPDGSAERLHGHNYRVYVEIDAALTRFGLVMDFKSVKPVVRELCDELDEHW